MYIYIHFMYIMGKSYCYTMTDIRAISMFLLHLYDLYIPMSLLLKFP